MTQYRTAKQVKKFDTFKIITFGILVVLLLLAWSFFRPVEAPPAITEAPTAEPATAATPAATEPASDVAPSVEAQIAAPALDLPGGALTPGSVTLSGTGEPGSEVEVVIDGQPVGKTTVGNDGKWSFTVDLPEPGDYQVSVQNVNADGNVLAASEAVTVKVAEAATEEVATAEAVAVAPALDLPGGDLTPGTVTLNGTGEAGSEVEIVVDGQVAGKTTVDSAGKWSFTADLPEPGDYQVSVQNVDADGNVLAASGVVTVKVAEVATEEVATAAAPAPATPALDAPSGELSAGMVNLTGTGEPGSEVQIVVDGQPVGQTTVDSAGKWSFPVELPDPGDHNISVQSLAAGGAVVTSSQGVAVQVGEAAAGSSVPTIDLPGDGLAAGEVTLTGTGEPGSEVQVVVDGQPVGKVTVDSEGPWSLPFDLPASGDYEINVQ
ncbi:MAG TPA: Ig-like domain-containing protein, partial [Anaerolineae bacterium]|nr:Ig-like domain-containing protein [Anaerolineae bacterium]